ncbi:MAG: hypothetical protein HOV66_29390, partial [Streptomycetaceae bacterium]|nr:hypothetical protein [Streptomycetaceae bacterium]
GAGGAVGGLAGLAPTAVRNGGDLSAGDVEAAVVTGFSSGFLGSATAALAAARAHGAAGAHSRSEFGVRDVDASHTPAIASDWLRQRLAALPAHRRDAAAQTLNRLVQHSLDSTAGPVRVHLDASGLPGARHYRVTVSDYAPHPAPTLHDPLHGPTRSHLGKSGRRETALDIPEIRPLPKRVDAALASIPHLRLTDAGDFAVAVSHHTMRRLIEALDGQPHAAASPEGPLRITVDGDDVHVHPTTEHNLRAIRGHLAVTGHSEVAVPAEVLGQPGDRADAPAGATGERHSAVTRVDGDDFSAGRAETPVWNHLSERLDAGLARDAATLTRQLCEVAASNEFPEVTVSGAGSRATVRVSYLADVAAVPWRARRLLGQYDHGVELVSPGRNLPDSVGHVTVWFEVGESARARSESPAERGVPDPVELSGELREILALNNYNSAGFGVDVQVRGDRARIRVSDFDHRSGRDTGHLLRQFSSRFGWDVTESPVRGRGPDGGARTFRIEAELTPFEMPPPVRSVLRKDGGPDLAVVFRPPRADEVDLVLGWERDTFGDHALDESTVYRMVTLRRTYGQYARIATVDDRVVGYALAGEVNPFALDRVPGRINMAPEARANWQERVAWIHAYAIADEPGLRGQGLCSRMVADQVEHMQRNGLVEARSTIALNNPGSFQVQRKVSESMGLGFELGGIYENYYAEGDLAEARAIPRMIFPRPDGTVPAPIPLPGNYSLLQTRGGDVYLLRDDGGGRQTGSRLRF